MAITPANPFGAFVAGRQARQDEEYGNARNALASMQNEQYPLQQQQQNTLANQQIQQGQQQLDANKAKIAYTKLAQALDSGNPKAYVLQNEPDLVRHAASAGHDIASMDDATAAQFLQNMARNVAGAAGIAPTKPEAFTLKPGEARYLGSKEVVSRPANPAEANSGFTLSPGQTRFGPDGKRIANVAPAPATVDPKTAFAQADKLRDEFNNQSKEFRSVADSYQRIRDSASDPSAAGDLALIFNYMKVLDPGSTVREGEFATAQNSGGVPAQIIARYNKVLNGERLAPEQRQDFVSRAGKLYKGQEFRWSKNTKGRYEKLARDLGVDPKYVTGDYSVPDETAAPQAPATEVRVNTPEEALSLPPGTVFVTPDGRRKVR